MEMGVFDRLPMEGAKSVQSLATECSSDPEFMQRILRAVASLGILEEAAEERYAHTTTSKLYCNPFVQASTRHMLDVVAVTMSQIIPYLRQNGFKSPSDIENTPTIAVRGLKDIRFFEWLSQNPGMLNTFNDAMAMHNIVGAKEVANTYPFDQLIPNADGISLVDVGGGKGHVLEELIATYPRLSGHVVLQDLDTVLSQGVVTTADKVRCQPYDFMQHQQPIKGASAYLFRHIFHDWPDTVCLQILQNHVAALKGQRSRILISDLVLPDQKADSSKALRDLNMMQIAGKERSLKQWTRLLDEAGYCISQIHGLQNQGNSIIEVVLKD